MAEHDLSSDLDDSHSSPERPQTAVAPAATSKRASRAPPSRKASSRGERKVSAAAARDASRRHKALERQFERAQKTSVHSPSSCPEALLVEDRPASHQPSSDLAFASAYPAGVLPTPPMGPIDLSLGPSRPRKAPPEATFTPTAAGLRPSESAPASHWDIQNIISATVSHTLAANRQQPVQFVPWPQSYPPCPPRGSHRSTLQASAGTHPSYSHLEEGHTDGSSSDEEEEDLREGELSEDEGMTPDKPAFTGLFRPSLFKSLLHKAKLASKLADPTSQEDTQVSSQPHDALFSAPKAEKDFIPCPQLFSETVQRSWALPSALPAPTGLDKKLYCSAPSLQDLLQLPSVDPPVSHLVSSSVLSGDVADGLRTEDRKAEFSCRRTHNAAAWAVRAATSASFFSRAALIWLHQLQDHLPPGNRRLQQDASKLRAATEYIADASLNAAKFASRALVSSVTSRRLLWLRHWRADVKSKWRLASAPYKGTKLFGESLDPILVEDKDKRKVMPSSYRRPDRKYSTFSSRQPFRADSGPSGSYTQRPPSYSFDRSSDRAGFRDRGRRPPPAKRPFRGAGSRPFRRGK